MEIAIERVAALGVGNRIAFGCECGKAEGLWVEEMPVVGEHYVVELGIEKPVSIGDNCTETTQDVGIRMKGDVVCVAGEVIEIWRGGAAFGLNCGCGATHEVAVPEITIGTQSGIRTHLDWVTRDSTGTIGCVECKASATAPLTPNQTADRNCGLARARKGHGQHHSDRRGRSGLGQRSRASPGAAGKAEHVSGIRRKRRGLRSTSRHSKKTGGS